MLACGMSRCVRGAADRGPRGTQGADERCWPLTARISSRQDHNFTGEAVGRPWPTPGWKWLMAMAPLSSSERAFVVTACGRGWVRALERACAASFRRPHSAVRKGSFRCGRHWEDAAGGGDRAEDPRHSAHRGSLSVTRVRRHRGQRNVVRVMATRSGPLLGVRLAPVGGLSPG